MHTISIVQIRPSADVPFFGRSSAEARAQLDQLDSAMENAAGFVSKTEKLSADKLVSLVVYQWESVEAYNAFVRSNTALIDAIKAARKNYNKAAGITRVVS